MLVFTQEILEEFQRKQAVPQAWRLYGADEQYCEN